MPQNTAEAATALLRVPQAMESLYRSITRVTEGFNNLVEAGRVSGGTGADVAELTSIGVAAKEMAGAARSLRERLSKDPLTMSMGAQLGLHALPRPYGGTNEAKLLQQALDKIHQITDAETQLAYARQLGLDGMLRLVQVSEKSWQAQKRDAEALERRLGPKVSFDNQEFQASLRRLESTFMGLARTVSSTAIPALTALTNKLADAFRILLDSDKLPGDSGELSRGRKVHRERMGKLEEASVELEKRHRAGLVGEPKYRRQRQLLDRQAQAENNAAAPTYRATIRNLDDDFAKTRHQAETGQISADQYTVAESQYRENRERTWKEGNWRLQGSGGGSGAPYAQYPGYPNYPGYSNPPAPGMATPPGYQPAYPNTVNPPSPGVGWHGPGANYSPQHSGEPDYNAAAGLGFGAVGIGAVKAKKMSAEDLAKAMHAPGPGKLKQLGEQIGAGPEMPLDLPTGKKPPYLGPQTRAAKAADQAALHAPFKDGGRGIWMRTQEAMGPVRYQRFASRQEALRWMQHNPAQGTRYGEFVSDFGSNLRAQRWTMAPGANGPQMIDKGMLSNAQQMALRDQDMHRMYRGSREAWVNAPEWYKQRVFEAGRRHLNPTLGDRLRGGVNAAREWLGETRQSLRGVLKMGGAAGDAAAGAKAAGEAAAEAKALGHAPYDLIQAGKTAWRNPVGRLAMIGTAGYVAQRYVRGRIHDHFRNREMRQAEAAGASAYQPPQQAPAYGYYYDAQQGGWVPYQHYPQQAAQAAPQAASSPAPVVKPEAKVSIRRAPTPGGSATIQPTRGGNQPLVLNYHDIVGSARDATSHYDVTAGAFAAQMARLAQQGYSSVSAADILKARQGKTQLPARSVAITFDDNYAGAMKHAVPILKQHGFKADFFVPSDYVGRGTHPKTGRAMMTAAQLRALSNDPSFAVHPHGSEHVDMTTIGQQRLAQDMAQSKQRLAAITGRTSDITAYPFGAVNAKVAAETRRHYALAFGSGSPHAPRGIDPNYAIPRMVVGRDSETASGFARQMARFGAERTAVGDRATASAAGTGEFLEMMGQYAPGMNALALAHTVRGGSFLNPRRLVAAAAAQLLGQSKSETGHAAGKMLSYGLIGAGIGSIIPGLGTGVGAGVGATIGAGVGLIDHFRKWNIEEKYPMAFMGLSLLGPGGWAKGGAGLLARLARFGSKSMKVGAAGLIGLQALTGPAAAAEMPRGGEMPPEGPEQGQIGKGSGFWENALKIGVGIGGAYLGWRLGYGALRRTPGMAQGLNRLARTLSPRSRAIASWAGRIAAGATALWAGSKLGAHHGMKQDHVPDDPSRYPAVPEGQENRPNDLGGGYPRNQPAAGPGPAGQYANYGTPAPAGGPGGGYNQDSGPLGPHDPYAYGDGGRAPFGMMQTPQPWRDLIGQAMAGNNTVSNASGVMFMDPLVRALRQNTEALIDSNRVMDGTYGGGERARTALGSGWNGEFLSRNLEGRSLLLGAFSL